METRLTALALVLPLRVRQVLQTACEMIDLSSSFDPPSSFDPLTDEGTVRITALDVVELIILGPLLAQIANAAPSMRFISTPFAYQPVEMLFRKPLDVAIVGEAFASKDLRKNCCSARR